MAQEETAERTSQDQLLHRIAEGDCDALAEFYDQTARMLFSVAGRILGDAHEAEDATHDVFLQIREKASTFNPDLGSPVAWAVGITRNRCLDRLRSRQRRNQLATRLENETKGAENDKAPSHSELPHDEASTLRSALFALPPEQRQAIEMAFFGGLTHQEIADDLHQPLGTIKARIRRGMLKLRETLRPKL